MKYELRPYQAESVDNTLSFLKNLKKKKENGIVIAPTGCHKKGTGILMYNGLIKNVEDVIIGDILIGPDSKPRNVLQLCQGKEKMYKITSIKGESFIVNENHILSLACTNEGKRYKSNTKKGETTFVTVKEYLTKSKSWKHLRKLHKAPLLSFDKNNYNLPIPPYILGIILGDGCTLNGVINITNSDTEVISEFKKYAEDNGMCIRISEKKGNPASTFSIIKKENKYNRFFKNSILEIFRENNLSEKGAAYKHVPQEYKISSIKNRLEILAGLLDTDGHLNGGCEYDFISKSETLTDDVIFLSRSLGLTARKSKEYKKCQTGFGDYYYRTCISGNVNIIPCKVERKKANERKQKKNNLVVGFLVENLDVDDFYGFKLDGDHQYMTSDFFIHHNSGKSIIISNTIKEYQEPTIILQPNKEILEQNYEKYTSYGFEASIYSASVGKKEVGDVTFATVGSIVNNLDLFQNKKLMLIDECDLVNPKGGMYEECIRKLDIPVIGYTATPYRLSTDGYGGSMLKFLTRTRPKVFSKVIYHIQNRELFDKGWLCKLHYWSIQGIDSSKLKPNSTGAEYDDEALQKYYDEIDFPDKIVTTVAKLLVNNRKHILVFTRFVAEALYLTTRIPNSAIITSETKKKDRERLLTDFKSGKIAVMLNVGVLTVGFDFPELDTVVIARPTMSLRLWYQMIGRGIRPHPNKQYGAIVDMGDNLRLFGKVEDLVIENEGGEKWFVSSKGKKLTNVYYER